MFAAVERPAQNRAAVINVASAGAEVDAGALICSREKVNRISGDAIRQHPELVGVDVVALVGMQEKSLAALTAFSTRAARNVALFHLLMVQAVTFKGVPHGRAGHQG